MKSKLDLPYVYVAIKLRLVMLDAVAYNSTLIASSTSHASFDNCAITANAPAHRPCHESRDVKSKGKIDIKIESRKHSEVLN